VLVKAPGEGTECRTAPSAGSMCAVPPEQLGAVRYVRWGPVPRAGVVARIDDCAPVIRLFCHAKS